MLTGKWRYKGHIELDVELREFILSTATLITITTCSGQLGLSRLGPITALKYSLIEQHHRSQNSMAARQAHLSKRSLQDAAVGALRKSAQGRTMGFTRSDITILM